MSKFWFASIVLLFVPVFEVSGQNPGNASHLVEIGVSDSLYSEVLGEQRQIWIHLPDRGNLREDYRYPVIYLLDGGVHLGGLAMVQEYYNFFRLPEMIVVAISNAENRTRDLTPTEVDFRNGMPVSESGGAEAFTRFLDEELIPYIDQSYPTSEHRALIGHSYGGLFAIYTLIHHSDLFRNYIAIDPSLDWDNQTFLNEALIALKNNDYTNKGLFVSVANEIIRFSDSLNMETVMSDSTEFSMGIRSALQFVRTAEDNQANGLHFDWKYYQKDIHGSLPLISMRDGLVFLYDWWELKRPSLYNDPATPTQELIALIREQNDSLTRNMGYPVYMDEELLTMLGYMSMDMDQPDKARSIFELVIEYYPESANALSALADFYESRGDMHNALLYARKALALSNSDELKARVDALAEKQ